MKRTAVLAAVAVVALVPAAGQAKAPQKTSRTATFSYTAFHGASTPAVYTGFENPCTVNTSACIDIPTNKWETQVSLEATDGSGTPVGLQYFFDGDYNTVVTTCSKADIPVKKGTLVSVVVAVDPTCAGVPTGGTVKAVITGKQ